MIVIKTVPATLILVRKLKCDGDGDGDGGCDGMVMVIISRKLFNLCK